MGLNTFNRISLLIVMFIIIGSCVTSVDSTIYCVEVLKKGDDVLVYRSELPEIINTKLDVTISGSDGFYIIEIVKTRIGWQVESQKVGLINFENGIVSLLNGC